MSSSVLKSVIIGGLFVVGIAYALFTYVYPSEATNGGSHKAIDTGAIENLVHKYVNEQRVKAGQAPLKLDQKISLVAQEHSKDMLEKNYYGHVSPDGINPSQRGQAAGVCITGENINELGTKYGDRPRNADETAQALVESWMKSPDHRYNILNPSFTMDGIGVVFDNTTDGQTGYITQDFC